MAYSQKLVDANDALAAAYINGTDSAEYKTAKADWMKVFAEVALERGEPVLAMENPYDTIMEAIADEADPAWIEEMLGKYEEMVECLESIGYCNASGWRSGYEECKTVAKI